MNINDYQISYRQISNFLFEAEIITPEKLVFYSKIKTHPDAINNEVLFQHFISKETKNHWALNIDIEEINESSVIVQAIETKSETQPESITS